MSKCSGEHQHHHDIICLRAKDAEIASLRAEIGNSEAVRLGMEKKIADLKDGLTAAHREVEDSLQKEIKRLDAEAERLKAAERIRVAGLRETRDALVEKLRAEVERLTTEADTLREETFFLRAEGGKTEVVISQLRDALSVRDAQYRQAEEDLVAERGKVERLEKSAEEHPPHDDKCKCDFCYFARLLRQILTGEG